MSEKDAAAVRGEIAKYKEDIERCDNALHQWNTDKAYYTKKLAALESELSALGGEFKVGERVVCIGTVTDMPATGNEFRIVLFDGAEREDSVDINALRRAPAEGEVKQTPAWMTEEWKRDLSTLVNNWRESFGPVDAPNAWQELLTFIGSTAPSAIDGHAVADKNVVDHLSHYFEYTDPRNKAEWLRIRDRIKVAPAAPSSAEPVDRQPDGYAYRYHDCIRHNGGGEVNAQKPIEAIPYFYRHPAPVSGAVAAPEKVVEEIRQAVYDCVNNVITRGSCNYREFEAALAGVVTLPEPGRNIAKDTGKPWASGERIHLQVYPHGGRCMLTPEYALKVAAALIAAAQEASNG